MIDNSGLTIHISKMNKDVKALEAFLKAVDCDVESEGCCKLFKALRAVVHNLDEPTFWAKYEELELEVPVPRPLSPKNWSWAPRKPRNRCQLYDLNGPEC